MKNAAFFWGLLFPLLLLSMVAFGQKEAPPKDKELPDFVDWTKARIGGDGLRYYIKETSKDPCLSHPEAFLKKHGKMFNLGEHGKLVLADSADYGIRENKYDGFYSYKYFYHGVEVNDAAMMFNMEAGKIGMIAVYIPNLTEIEKEFENIISREQAKQYLKKIETPKHDELIPFDPILRLRKMEYQYNGQYSYYYIFNAIYNSKNDDKTKILKQDLRFYIMDAKTGKIVQNGSLIQHSSCLESCDDQSIGSGGENAIPVLPPTCTNSDDPITIDCDNSFIDFHTIPTVRNFANIPNCTSAASEETCRQVSLEFCINLTASPPEDQVIRLNRDNLTETRRITAYTGKTAYFSHMSQPDGIGTGANAHEGDIIAFPNKSDFVFTEENLMAATAFGGVGMAKEYFESQHGINSFDNLGAPVEVVLDINTSDIAGYVSSITFQLPDEPEQTVHFNQIHIGPSNLNTSLEHGRFTILIHEYTHAVLLNYFNIDNPQFDTEAIHEGISDIFALAGEHHLGTTGVICPSQWDWEFDIIDNRVRNFEDPTMSAPLQLKTYNTVAWNTAKSKHITGDGGAQYEGCGVITHWFYLLSEDTPIGTNGLGHTYPAIEGIGIEEAAEIIWGGLKELSLDMNTSPTIPQLRSATINYVYTELKDCEIAKQVMNAWHAVGVGNAYNGTPYN